MSKSTYMGHNSDERRISIRTPDSEYITLPIPEYIKLDRDDNGTVEFFTWLKPVLKKLDTEYKIKRVLGEDYKLYYKTENNDIKIYLQDNLELLKSLKSETFDLIYCDILYNTGTKFPDYDDNLGEPTTAIKWWYEPRLYEIKRILKPTGSLYIHCDWHLNSYMRVELDKIFGYKQYKNEIIRQCTNAKNNSNNWGKIYDNILYYTKTDTFTFNTPTESKLEVDLVNQYNKIKNGEYYTTIPLHGKGETKLGETGQPWISKSHGLITLPKGRHWAISHSELEKLDELGLIEWSKNDNPRKILYAKDYQDRPIQNIWNLKSLGVSPNKVQQYSTQKPVELLDRIIKTSSNEGDLVGDFFLGGGTTAVVCKMNGRKFIGCDIQTKALELTKNKLEAIK